MFPIDRTKRIDLGPLSLGAMRHLLEERLGRSYTRIVLRRLYEASGGNPFSAIEIARVLDPGRDPGPGEPLPVPARLNELLQARLRALPPETLETLQAAAALAHPSLELIEQATGEGARARIRPAMEAGVVELQRGRVNFAHPLLVEALRSTLSRRDEQADLGPVPHGHRVYRRPRE